jgi:DNA-directed RNA polymerase specialized sigma24 family protein
MLASYHDAEDALQETLLRAWRALASFEGRSTLRAWLYKIATNAALDVAKRRYRRELPVSYGPPVTAGAGRAPRWSRRPGSSPTVDPATGAWVASALTVLSLRGERIAGADYFLTAELLQRWGDDSSADGAGMFARFGLPATIP